jgi:hypothetical protein
VCPRDWALLAIFKHLYARALKSDGQGEALLKVQANAPACQHDSCLSGCRGLRCRRQRCVEAFCHLGDRLAFQSYDETDRSLRARSRTVERFAAFGFDLGLVMESSEVCATHPPHHLSPARLDHSRRGRILRPVAAVPVTQQRSVRTRMPANSEHDCYSPSRTTLRFAHVNQGARVRLITGRSQFQILSPIRPIDSLGLSVNRA